MGIEYFIIAMGRDGAATKEEVLDAFSPYWTEKEQDYYFLDYGKEMYQGMVIHNECHFYIRFYENDVAVEGVTIIKPCGDIEMERAVFQLIHKFPMIATYPVEPLLIVTANQQCVEMIKENYPELLDDLTVVSSFDEYYDLI